MVSFPPHCSHKLQPLDRAVFGPLERFYNSARKEKKTLKQTKQQKKFATKAEKKRETKNYLLGIKDNINQNLLHNLTLTNDDNIKETL